MFISPQHTPPVSPYTTTQKNGIGIQLIYNMHLSYACGICKAIRSTSHTKTDTYTHTNADRHPCKHVENLTRQHKCMTVWWGLVGEGRGFLQVDQVKKIQQYPIRVDRC